MSRAKQWLLLLQVFYATVRVLDAGAFLFDVDMVCAVLNMLQMGSPIFASLRLIVVIDGAVSLKQSRRSERI